MITESFDCPSERDTVTVNVCSNRGDFTPEVGQILFNHDDIQDGEWWVFKVLELKGIGALLEDIAGELIGNKETMGKSFLNECYLVDPNDNLFLSMVEVYKELNS